MQILIIHNSYQQPGSEDVAADQEASLLRQAGHADFLVMAFAWTWSFENRQTLKDLVSYLAKKHGGENPAGMKGQG
jgi:hypothetical protein